MKKLHQSKTFWTGVTGLITAVGGYFTGALDLAAAVQTGLTSLIGIFIRSGMIKG